MTSIERKKARAMYEARDKARKEARTKGMKKVVVKKSKGRR